MSIQFHPAFGLGPAPAPEPPAPAPSGAPSLFVDVNPPAPTDSFGGDRPSIFVDVNPPAPAPAPAPADPFGGDRPSIFVQPAPPAPAPAPAPEPAPVSAPPPPAPATPVGGAAPALFVDPSPPAPAPAPAPTSEPAFDPASLFQSAPEPAAAPEEEPMGTFSVALADDATRSASQLGTGIPNLSSTMFVGTNQLQAGQTFSSQLNPQGFSAVQAAGIDPNSVVTPELAGSVNASLGGTPTSFAAPPTPSPVIAQTPAAPAPAPPTATPLPTTSPLLLTTPTGQSVTLDPSDLATGSFDPSQPTFNQLAPQTVNAILGQGIDPNSLSLANAGAPGAPTTPSPVIAQTPAAAPVPVPPTDLPQPATEALIQTAPDGSVTLSDAAFVNGTLDPNLPTFQQITPQAFTELENNGIDPHSLSFAGPAGSTNAADLGGPITGTAPQFGNAPQSLDQVDFSDTTFVAEQPQTLTTVPVVDASPFINVDLTNTTAPTGVPGSSSGTTINTQIGPTGGPVQANIQVPIQADANGNNVTVPNIRGTVGFGNPEGPINGTGTVEFGQSPLGGQVLTNVNGQVNLGENVSINGGIVPQYQVTPTVDDNGVQTNVLQQEIGVTGGIRFDTEPVDGFVQFTDQPFTGPNGNTEIRAGISVDAGDVTGSITTEQNSAVGVNDSIGGQVNFQIDDNFSIETGFTDNTLLPDSSNIGVDFPLPFDGTGSLDAIFGGDGSWGINFGAEFLF